VRVSGAARTFTVYTLTARAGIVSSSVHVVFGPHSEQWDPNSTPQTHRPPMICDVQALGAIV
jgi:hypothetical protein